MTGQFPPVLNACMRTLRKSTVLVAVLALGVLSTPSAHAETVAVDPGRQVSAGKPITGSGQNLPTLKSTAIWDIGSSPAELLQAYYTSGHALRDQTAVARAARVWATKWARDVCGPTPAEVRDCRLAAVFDIDDTLLSSYPTLSTNSPSFTYSPAADAAAISACTQPVIQPVKSLYLALRRMGFATALITGRSESEREATVACLAQNGITDWVELVMKPSGSTTQASSYKAQARRSLAREGWRIGPSVGDQVSDMSFGSLAHGFLIPNPMYLIP